MPAPNQNNNTNAKKKKKGHAPAHQNKFAFAHNPNSRTTLKILAMPVNHVCRRCNDKLEWRKKYRKYKPRTQPSKCNGCQKRNVLAAYHTLCTACTKTSAKAREVIEAEQQNDEEMNLRACAICVKEIALPDPGDEEDDGVTETGRMSLRERKSMERKMERDAKKSSSKTKNVTSTEEEEDQEEGGKEVLDSVLESPAEGEKEETDPFLKAVGGADKLLTGEAYQQNVLAQEKQQKEE